jgi:hypothetical protein
MALVHGLYPASIYNGPACLWISFAASRWTAMEYKNFEELPLDEQSSGTGGLTLTG